MVAAQSYVSDDAYEFVGDVIYTSNQGLRFFSLVLPHGVGLHGGAYIQNRRNPDVQAIRKLLPLYSESYCTSE